MGAEFGASAMGNHGVSIAGNAQGSSQHANGNSATAVDTTVSATNNVTITAPGKTTLNGAQVSGNHITVDTGNLDITSPQDSSYYNSKTTQAGLNVKIPTPAGGDLGVGGSYGNQHIKDNYQTTGNTLSGLYAGNGGLNVHVSDTTHLTAGVISSTADASQNHFETGKLITDSLTNQSKWNATSTGGGFSLGTDSLGSSMGPLGMIVGNLAANSGKYTTQLNNGSISKIKNSTLFP